MSPTARTHPSPSGPPLEATRLVELPRFRTAPALPHPNVRANTPFSSGFIVADAHGWPLGVPLQFGPMRTVLNGVSAGRSRWHPGDPKMQKLWHIAGPLACRVFGVPRRRSRIGALQRHRLHRGVQGDASQARGPAETARTVTPACDAIGPGPHSSTSPGIEVASITLIALCLRAAARLGVCADCTPRTITVSHLHIAGETSHRQHS